MFLYIHIRMCIDTPTFSTSVFYEWKIPMYLRIHQPLYYQHVIISLIFILLDNVINMKTIARLVVILSSEERYSPQLYYEYATPQLWLSWLIPLDVQRNNWQEDYTQVCRVIVSALVFLLPPLFKTKLIMHLWCMLFCFHPLLNNKKSIYRCHVINILFLLHALLRQDSTSTYIQ